MSLNFRWLSAFYYCPYAYLELTRLPFSVLERGRDIRRVIKVYHAPENAGKRLEAAMDMLLALCTAITEPRKLGLYQKMFEWMRLYDRLHQDVPRHIRPKGRRLKRTVSGLDINLTVDLVETPPNDRSNAWLISTEETPPPVTTWPTSFGGQLALSIIRQGMPDIAQVHICYLRAGVVHSYNLQEVEPVPSFEATLQTTVTAFQNARTFPKQPGPHCFSCLHMRTGKCHPNVIPQPHAAD